MSRIPLLKASQAWSCPNCSTTETTPPLPPGSSRFHTCAGLHMLTAPLIMRALLRQKVDAGMALRIFDSVVRAAGSV